MNNEEKKIISDEQRQINQEEELENKDSSKKVLLGIFGTMILVVAVIGVSFAMFYFSMKLSSENTLTTGTISMAFQDTTYIDITNALPMSDEEGMAMSGDYKYMDFSVSAKFSGPAAVDFEISAVDETDTSKYQKVPYENLKILICEKGKEDSCKPVLYSKLGNPTLHSDITGFAREQDKLLLSDTLSSKKRHHGNRVVTKNYRLKMWIDSETEDLSIPKTFKLKVRLDAVQHKK